MAEHILQCLQCRTYTMEEICKTCKERTTLARPPKYSPEDKYGDYRRKAKKMLGKE